MPIKPENKCRYPSNWKSIRVSILERANNLCEQCGVENYALGYWHDDTFIKEKEGRFFDRNVIKIVLTIAHLDHTPENCAPHNLRALCQRCHNRYDRKHRNETIKKARNK